MKLTIRASPTAIGHLLPHLGLFQFTGPTDAGHQKSVTITLSDGDGVDVDLPLIGRIGFYLAGQEVELRVPLSFGVLLASRIPLRRQGLTSEPTPRSAIAPDLDLNMDREFSFPLVGLVGLRLTP